MVGHLNTFFEKPDFKKFKFPASARGGGCSSFELIGTLFRTEVLLSIGSLDLSDPASRTSVGDEVVGMVVTTGANCVY